MPDFKRKVPQYFPRVKEFHLGPKNAIKPTKALYGSCGSLNK